MKASYLFFLMICFFSCKKGEKTNQAIQKEQDSLVVVKDTIYCNESILPLPEIKEVSMYNVLYKSEVIMRFSKNKTIKNNNDTSIAVCYEKEAHVKLFKEKDTVFNLIVDMTLINKELDEWKASYYKENTSKQEFPDYLKNLQLDSVKVGVARTKHLHYKCFFSDSITHKNYENSLAVDYLDKIGDHFLRYETREIE